MEEGRRGRPIVFPANYVTLRQLQEEQMIRNLRKEEEEERMRREEEQKIILVREEEQKIILVREEEEERRRRKKKKKHEGELIYRKVENEAVKSNSISVCKEEVEGEGEKPKPNPVRKNKKWNRRKGAKKKEGEGLTGQVFLTEDRNLETSTKAEEKEREDGRERDLKQCMQSERVTEVDKAIGGLSLGGKGVDGERKTRVSDRRSGGVGRGFERHGRGQNMIWVKKSPV